MFSPKLSLLTSCFKGEEYLKSFFENVLEQSFFEQSEIVFMHNSPTGPEIALVKEFSERYPEHIQYIPIDPVESLGESWNRGWQAARCDFLTIWNVDDRRVSDSLLRQFVLLKNHPDCAMTYGDYLIVNQLNSRHGLKIPTPEFETRKFLRGFPSGGAFLMWRKEIAEKVGLFDEQFRCALDFEYAIRLVASGEKLIRTDGLIGFFTDENKGLSTRNGASLASIEETAIQLRYGNFDKVKIELLDQARKYEISNFLNHQNWISIQNVIPGYLDFIKKQQPLWAFGKVKNSVRLSLARIGLWNLYIKLRTRFILGAKRV